MKTKVIFLLIFIISNTTQTYSQSFEYITSKQYGHATLYSKQNSYWKFWVPANTMGVFTLKNESYSSDFDIYIYKSQYLENKVASGNETGTQTELVTTDIKDYGRTVYIKIVNYGDYSSKFEFYPHYIDFSAKFEDALLTAGLEYATGEFIKWLFEIEDNNSDDSENAERAANVAISILKGENFSGVTKGAIKREITSSIRDELGYGFWGDFALNFAIDVVDDIYRNYW